MSEAPYSCPECGHPLEKHQEAEAIGYACWHDVTPGTGTSTPCGCTYRWVKPPLATFYAVRNHEGKYYRTYDKNRSSGWKDNLEDAKLWTRIGPARSKITALSHGKGPVPELIEFVVHTVNVVDQTDRVAKAKAKKEREEAERKAAEKRWKLQEAERELAEAQRRVEKLRRT